MFGELSDLLKKYFKEIQNMEQKPSPESQDNSQENQEEKILCPHCLRTASNGIKCKGICVADSDY